MEYIKREIKKLGSMSLIGVGSFLILEHIYTYGGIDLFDLLGHEWMGIVLISVGILTANKWGRLKLVDAKTEALNKIKYIFGDKK